MLFFSIRTNEDRYKKCKMPKTALNEVSDGLFDFPAQRFCEWLKIIDISIKVNFSRAFVYAWI